MRGHSRWEDIEREGTKDGKLSVLEKQLRTDIRGTGVRRLTTIQAKDDMIVGMRWEGEGLTKFRR